VFLDKTEGVLVARAREHRVDQHHALEGGRDGGRSAEPTIGFADGFVQLSMPHVVDTRGAQSYVDA
jgi:hypothetical protein